MKALITLCITAVFFISCDETKKVIDTAGNVKLAGNYTVTLIDNNMVSENQPTISFMAYDKTIKGNTGCNSFFGKYALDLYALSFSDIGSTERACEEPIMTNENKFLQALRNTGSYALENNELTLYSKNDRSILVKAQKEVNQ